MGDPTLLEGIIRIKRIFEDTGNQKSKSAESRWHRREVTVSERHGSSLLDLKDSRFLLLWRMLFSMFGTGYGGIEL